MLIIKEKVNATQFDMIVNAVALMSCKEHCHQFCKEH